MQFELPVYDAARETLQANALISACLTEPCSDHDRGSCMFVRPPSCFYFHAPGQKRRNILGDSNQILYWDLMCPDISPESFCSRGAKCEYSHSKTEICYHPARFKTKLCNGYECRGSVCCFAHSSQELRSQAPLLYGLTSRLEGPQLRGDSSCPKVTDDAVTSASLSSTRQSSGAPLTRLCSTYPGCENCEFGFECPFAHDLTEVITPLLDPSKADFFVSSFKTQWCVFSHHHDWNNCIYAHNSQDCRRPPSIGYGPHPCSTWDSSDPRLAYTQRCPHGLRCPYSHGRKEQLYHPSFYRTNPCCDWRRFTDGCIRGPICAFFHDFFERKVAQPLTGNIYGSLLDETVVTRTCGHLKEKPALVSAQPVRARNRRREDETKEDLDMNEFVNFALN